tara:strand:+ start:301 stop:543 length:243 start_codon:yes stop_codon:yes gene_type:complete
MPGGCICPKKDSKSKKGMLPQSPRRNVKAGGGPRSSGITGIMKEHSKHHSPKHMKMMRQDMSKGMSFEKAHKKAMKQVGK